MENLLDVAPACTVGILMTVIFGMNGSYRGKDFSGKQEERNLTFKFYRWEILLIFSQQHSLPKFYLYYIHYVYMMKIKMLIEIFKLKS